ncbi:hypothetical protein CEXT_629061 [Caerostris extrusa]|uniref:Uncharacterized protein n=1 Tax=Caerostris extrusa TaxID=172846 RepID=A0AAV4P4Y1_CAEEX|nr:hypothetical protein CEXT_629061 [Caerostris extrusa]
MSANLPKLQKRFYVKSGIRKFKSSNPNKSSSSGAIPKLLINIGSCGGLRAIYQVSVTRATTRDLSQTCATLINMDWSVRGDGFASSTSAHDTRIRLSPVHSLGDGWPAD